MRALCLCAVVAVLISVPCTAEAGGGGKGKKADGTRGIITSVDLAGKSFTFQSGKKNDPSAEEVTVQFNESTRFLRLENARQSSARAEDLAPRARVAVVYESSGGKNIARKVILLPRPRKKA